MENFYPIGKKNRNQITMFGEIPYIPKGRSLSQEAALELATFLAICGSHNLSD